MAPRQYCRSHWNIFGGVVEAQRMHHVLKKVRRTPIIRKDRVISHVRHYRHKSTQPTQLSYYWSSPRVIHEPGANVQLHRTPVASLRAVSFTEMVSLRLHTRVSHSKMNSTPANGVSRQYTFMFGPRLWKGG
jgi:hypothetical protein